MAQVNSNKLIIKVEAENSTPTNLVFDDTKTITVLFNPDKLVLSKSTNWTSQKAQGRDVPEMQFNNSEPRTLRVDLIFDTYDPDDPNMKDKDVRTEYTKKFHHLMTVEKNGSLHRPPVCRLHWGSGPFFQGVLKQMEQQYILFTGNGVPVRAKLNCTFLEWRTNQSDIMYQDLQSSDIAKAHIVKRGDTLSSISTREYRDPKLWRAIARENEIENPRDLVPGTILTIPTVQDREKAI